MFTRASHRILGNVVVFAITLVVPTVALSEVQWELGVKLGPHFGKMTGDATTDFAVSVPDNDVLSGDEDLTSGSLEHARDAFSGGVYGVARLSGRFGIRLETLFTRKGGIADVGGTLEISDTSFVNYVGDIALTLDYVEVPLLAVLSLPTSAGLTLEAVAGPAVAFNVKAERKLELSASSFYPSNIVVVYPDFQSSRSITEPLDAVIKGTDFAGVLGASLVYPTDAFDLLLDLRWTFSLASIDDSAGGEDLKNRGFSISVGWSFPIASGDVAP